MPQSVSTLLFYVSISCITVIVPLGVPVGAADIPRAKMVAVSLKICVRQCNVVKTMQFEPSTPVYDACRIIRERVPEAQSGQGTGTSLSVFLSVCLEDATLWLQVGKHINQ